MPRLVLFTLIALLTVTRAAAREKVIAGYFALINRGGQAEARPKTYTITTFDRSDIRLACYRSIILIVLQKPEEFVAPTPEDIVMDTAAAARQTALAPLAVKIKLLLHKRATFVRGVNVPRVDAVFETGEQIAYRFTDLTRPADETATIEILKDVTVQ